MCFEARKGIILEEITFEQLASGWHPNWYYRAQYPRAKDLQAQQTNKQTKMFHPSWVWLRGSIFKNRIKRARFLLLQLLPRSKREELHAREGMRLYRAALGWMFDFGCFSCPSDLGCLGMTNVWYPKVFVFGVGSGYLERPA